MADRKPDAVLLRDSHGNVLGAVTNFRITEVVPPVLEVEPVRDWSGFETALRIQTWGMAIRNPSHIRPVEDWPAPAEIKEFAAMMRAMARPARRLPAPKRLHKALVKPLRRRLRPGRRAPVGAV